jgi:hypothetical protein
MCCELTRSEVSPHHRALDTLGFATRYQSRCCESGELLQRPWITLIENSPLPRGNRYMIHVDRAPCSSLQSYVGNMKMASKQTYESPPV